MSAQKLPLNALDDPNMRRRVIEILNQLTELLPVESGTWTATIRGSGTAGTYEIATQYSRFTRAGRRIWLDFYITLAGAITAGGTGFIQITGAPFSKAADSDPVGAVRLSGVDWTAGSQHTASFIAVTETSTLYIDEYPDNGAQTQLQISGLAAGDSIIGSICYETDDP